MAVQIINEGQIGINGKIYNTRSKLKAKYVTRFPSKMNIGSDSYDQENFLSNLTMNDWRGGLGVSEMDKPGKENAFWFGNLNTDYRGHLLMPRKANGMLGSLPASITWTDPTSANDPDTVWGDDNSIFDNNTATVAYMATGGSGVWTNYLESVHAAISTDVVRYWVSCSDVSSSHKVDVDVYTGSAWVDVYEGGFVNNAWEVRGILGGATSITKIRIRLYDGTGTGGFFRIHEVDFGIWAGTATSLGKLIHFNGNLYVTSGAYLFRLNSTRTRWYAVYNFPASITKLIVGPNNCLYIYLGDADEYWYMDTGEACRETNVTDATYGVYWDSKLWKMDADGNWWYTATPNAAAPAWTSQAGITDIASQIENLEVGKDANGDDVIYCATNSVLKMFDFTNNKWLDTALNLPNHPNGGKGFTYWRDGLYISSGLSVKRYIPGPTSSITDVGLDRNDGIPSEYNGEIVKLLGDGASNDLFALVDSSQVTGTQKSGVYAWNGHAWRAWYLDSTYSDQVMTDAVVSSAASAYALYFTLAAAVYFIDLPRGIQNISQVIADSNFESSSSFLITSWYDLGSAALKKLWVRLTSWAKRVTTTEYLSINYRIDKSNIDIGTGWTLLDTLDTAGENGEKTNALASGAGLAFNTIQFRINMVTNGSGTPDLQALTAACEMLTGEDGNWIFSVDVVCDGAHGTTARDKVANLDAALENDTLVPVIFRNETHYCRIRLTDADMPSGEHFEGTNYSLQMVEV